MSTLTALAEKRRLPDALIRVGIRQRLRGAIRNARRQHASGAEKRFLEESHRGPIAVATQAANEQHYELPAAFFSEVLGPNKKYSCCLYERGDETLEEAESAMLRLTCERAGIQDGMHVLDLGCGWGALSLWIAGHFPQCSVTGVSNSASQREYIEGEAERRGISNLKIVTADINMFRPEQKFDRVVSVEMMEHVRNHRLLFQRISGWLKPGGKLFVHIFCHQQHAYPYQTEGASNWMGRYFFAGGMMPSFNLFHTCDDALVVESEWRVNGRHYERTCRQWLERLDARRDAVMPLMSAVYGQTNSDVWFGRWRIFFLACAELFGYRGGEEWFVGHYLLVPRKGA
jgi:cyclopropane-fatty-acyl-phospholipid synthase